jgi:hypothetical protein
LEDINHIVEEEGEMKGILAAAPDDTESIF